MLDKFHHGEKEAAKFRRKILLLLLMSVLWIKSAYAMNFLYHVIFMKFNKRSEIFYREIRYRISRTCLLINTYILFYFIYAFYVEIVSSIIFFIFLLYSLYSSSRN